MSEPLVSIIIPLYNYAQYIPDCIQSALNQTYKNTEIVICDDCSKDKSYKVARKYEVKHEKVKLIRLDANSGYSKAKNEAIIASKGELITCIDADDILAKDSVACRVAALKETGCDLVHAKALTIQSQTTLKQCYALVKGKQETPVIHAQTVMMYRWVHHKFGLYDEVLRSRADKEMWIRLLGDKARGPHLIKHTFLAKNVAYYRSHKASMHHQRAKKPKLQKRLTAQLKHAINMRATEGITKENSRFLET